MSKKITKTIALIVFLVLLGINSPMLVSARDTGTCTYSSGSGDTYTVVFSLSGQKEIISAKKGNSDIEYQNWNSVKTNLLHCANIDDNGNGTNCDYVCPGAIELRRTIEGCDLWNSGKNKSYFYLYFYDKDLSGHKKSDAESQISTFLNGQTCNETKNTGSMKCGTVDKGSSTVRCFDVPNPTIDIHRDNPDVPSNNIECDGQGCREVTINSNVTPIELDLSTYSCGGGMLKGVSGSLLSITSVAYTLMLIAVPIIIIVLGSIDLLKGVMAQKEDEIKKGQQVFIKRLIAGLIVFFVLAIVKFSVSIFNKSNSKSIVGCVNCIIEGPDSGSCVQDS